MTWEYLDTDIFQARFGIIAAYLREYAKGATLVDLNCGKEAHLFDYLRDDLNQYVGNDINLRSGGRIGKHAFLKYNDTEVLAALNYITDKVDIFCHLGWGAGIISREPVESQTDTISGRAIVQEYMPQLVILESVEKYFQFLLKEYSPLLESSGYELAHSLSLQIDNPDSFVNRRQCAFWEKH